MPPKKKSTPSAVETTEISVTAPTMDIEVLPAGPIVLPGATEVDPVLLDQAVKEINRIIVGKVLEVHFAVGEYVLNTFFGGDPENFHSRAKGHATFRALGGREDLRLSYSALYNVVAVVDQRRYLPDDLASALPFTHQKLLLPIKDEGDKVDLARRAVDDDLSTRELADEVKKLKESQRNGARLGRPNLPAFVKAFGRLKSIREQAASEPITAESFANYSPEKAKVLLADLDQWIRGLQETADQVRDAMGAWSDTTPKEDEPS